jgi:hypothetical protein
MRLHCAVVVLSSNCLRACNQHGVKRHFHEAGSLPIEFSIKLVVCHHRGGVRRGECWAGPRRAQHPGAAGRPASGQLAAALGGRQRAGPRRVGPGRGGGAAAQRRGARWAGPGRAQHPGAAARPARRPLPDGVRRRWGAGSTLGRAGPRRRRSGPGGALGRAGPGAASGRSSPTRRPARLRTACGGAGGQAKQYYGRGHRWKGGSDASVAADHTETTFGTCRTQPANLGRHPGPRPPGVQLLRGKRQSSGPLSCMLFALQYRCHGTHGRKEWLSQKAY